MHRSPLGALAADLATYDPEEAYAVGVRDREMALSYVRKARYFAHAPHAEILSRFGEISRATGHLQEPADWKAAGVARLPIRCRPSMAQCRQRNLPGMGTPVAPTKPQHMAEIETAKPVEIRLDRARQRACIADLVYLTGANFEVLDKLAKVHLGAGAAALTPRNTRPAVRGV